MVNNYRGAIVNGKWQPRNCILGDEVGRWWVVWVWYGVALPLCAALVALSSCLLRSRPPSQLPWTPILPLCCLLRRPPCVCVLQMGLGKTAQSIAVVAWLKQYAATTHPCMVVAPLTTLGHWKREIQTWTDLVRRLLLLLRRALPVVAWRCWCCWWGRACGVQILESKH